MAGHQGVENHLSDGQIFALHETQYGAEKKEKHR